jgi:hypothetical protein
MAFHYFMAGISFITAIVWTATAFESMKIKSNPLVAAGAICEILFAAAVFLRIYGVGA